MARACWSFSFRRSMYLHRLFARKYSISATFIYQPLSYSLGEVLVEPILCNKISSCAAIIVSFCPAYHYFVTCHTRQSQRFHSNNRFRKAHNLLNGSIGLNQACPGLQELCSWRISLVEILYFWTRSLLQALCFLWATFFSFLS